MEQQISYHQHAQSTRYYGEFFIVIRKHRRMPFVRCVDMFSYGQSNGAQCALSNIIKWKCGRWTKR